MSKTIIETERLRLREWREGDELLLDRHCNTESVMRWLGGIQDNMRQVAGRFADWQLRFGHTYWVVERKEDGEFLGFCGLKRTDGAGSTVLGELEVGWRLREDAWGKGYAREAAIAVLDFAFDNLGAERVFALTAGGNAPSRALMERLGMKHRPDLDYDDADWPASVNPTLVYELKRGNT